MLTLDINEIQVNHETIQFLKFDTLHNENSYAIEIIFDTMQIFFFFTMSQQPPAGHGLLIIEDSRSHSDTPHAEGLLWTSG
jgi:hypothetical protein